MDFGAVLSSLLKPQVQFPPCDPATLLSLATMKGQWGAAGGYGIPNYAQALIQCKAENDAKTGGGGGGGVASFDLASLFASSAQHEPSLKETTPISTPSVSTALSLPIPAQPSSPTQSSASASSISSIQSNQNSPSSGISRSSVSVSARASTPVGMAIAGCKRSISGTPTRKPPAPTPDEKKDEAYYERRKKNNDAAKRSRDARRHKEEQTAARANFLEQENLQLRSQVDMLRREIAQLQMLLITKSATPGTPAFSLPSVPATADSIGTNSSSESAGDNSQE